MLGFLSTDLILKNTFSLTTTLLSNNIDYHYNTDDLRHIFVDNDILSDIGIIKSFVDEQEKSLCDKSPTVRAAVQNLCETLHYLEQEINTLVLKINKHDLKWFASYRSYDIANEVKKIKVLINQMNHRFDLLLKLS